MAAKKPSGSKKTARVEKSEAPVAAAKMPAPRKQVWTLPLAMVMLCLGATALWIAVRESSNAPEAATSVPVTMSPAAAAKKPSATVPTAAPAPTAPRAAETSAAAVAKPVSITGCLKRDGDAFVLRDTDGAEAPKSRSWKSGFLRRSKATVMLTDAGNAAHLSDHVGRRVSVTGPVVEREMRVQSLRRVSPTCE